MNIGLRINTVYRNELEDLLSSDKLRKGKMLRISWPRKTDKKVKENGVVKIVEPAGTLISRRLVLRSDWSKPTKTFTPKGGNMFNVSTAKAEQIKKENQLYLFFSLEGVTHPHGEKDHPVNVPLDRICEIEDLKDRVLYRIMDEENVTNVEISCPDSVNVL